MAWLPLLLAVSAVAAEPRLLDQCLNNDPNGAGAFYRKLTAGEQSDFRSLYAAFEKNVVTRNEEGWSHGKIGNFWTNLGNSWAEHGFWKGLIQEPNTYAESVTKLQAELKRAQDEEVEAARLAAQNKSSAQAQRVLAERTKRRKDLEELLDNRSFGRCNDWALDTRDVLKKVAQKSFSIDTKIHVSNAAMGDSGSHIFAVACRPSPAGGCLAFDPWMRGLPELATLAEQEKGSGQSYTCFKATKPAL
jgi:hypothetical protein